MAKPAYRTITLLMTLLTIGFSATAFAEKIDYVFSEATPVGSWQIREDTATDHKGRQTLSVIKTSLIGEETRDNEMHYWVEMEIDHFKLKNNTRKKQDDTMVMKTLIAASALQSDPVNTTYNIKAFAKEIIMQHGEQDPIKISGAGMFADMMMKALGVKVTYDYQVGERESISVPAGAFHAQKISGTGTTEINALIKKMQVESRTTTWISKSVPFAIIKMYIESTVDNKPQKMESVLIKYGKSGAQSKITKPPVAMPELPGKFMPGSNRYP